MYKMFQKKSFIKSYEAFNRIIAVIQLDFVFDIHLY